MGLFSKKAPQFNPSNLPEYKQMTDDINKVRDLRDRDITGVRGSTQLGLDQLEKDRMGTMGDIQAGSVGRFGAMQDTLARQGGVDSGSRERLAAQSGKDATMARQKAGGDFSRLAADMTSQDFAAQEGLKDQAMFAMPQMSQMPLGIQTKAAAANMQGAAAAKSSRSAMLGGLGSIAGTVMGGPLGGAIGGGLFSMF